MRPMPFDFGNVSETYTRDLGGGTAPVDKRYTVSSSIRMTGWLAGRPYSHNKLHNLRRTKTWRLCRASRSEGSTPAPSKGASPCITVWWPCDCDTVCHCICSGPTCTIVAAVIILMVGSTYAMQAGPGRGLTEGAVGTSQVAHGVESGRYCISMSSFVADVSVLY